MWQQLVDELEAKSIAEGKDLLQHFLKMQSKINLTDPTCAIEFEFFKTMAGSAG